MSEHPVKSALTIKKKITELPSSMVPCKVLKQKHYITSLFYEDKEKVFDRLVHCNRIGLLKDKFPNILFSIKNNKEKRLNCQNDPHIVPNHPIAVPTCCDYHSDTVSDSIEEHKQLIYDSPEPYLPATNLHKLRRSIASRQPSGESASPSYPQSAVYIRWKQPAAPGHAGLDQHHIRHYMRRWGAVERVVQRSACSATVVYRRLEDACQAVRAGVLQVPGNRLCCTWLRAEMRDRLVLLTGRGGVKTRHTELGFLY